MTLPLNNLPYYRIQVHANFFSSMYVELRQGYGVSSRSYRELDITKKNSRNLFGTFHALLYWFFIKFSAKKVLFGILLIAILTLKTWIFTVEWNSEFELILYNFRKQAYFLMISLTFQAWKKENPMITEFQFLSGTRWRLIVGFDLEDFKLNLYYLFMLFISIIMLFLFPPPHYLEYFTGSRNHFQILQYWAFWILIFFLS